jgi:hypothetical protein
LLNGIPNRSDEGNGVLEIGPEVMTC